MLPMPPFTSPPSNPLHMQKEYFGEGSGFLVWGLHLLFISKKLHYSDSVCGSEE